MKIPELFLKLPVLTIMMLAAGQLLTDEVREEIMPEGSARVTVRLLAGGVALLS